MRQPFCAAGQPSRDQTTGIAGERPAAAEDEEEEEAAAAAAAVTAAAFQGKLPCSHGTIRNPVAVHAGSARRPSPPSLDIPLCCHTAHAAPACEGRNKAPIGGAVDPLPIHGK